MSLNNKPFMVRHFLIGFNPVDLRFYLLMISLGKCSENLNSANDLSRKLCVPYKIKDINVKAINIITNENEAKIKLKRIWCDCKCKCNSTTCNSN